MPSEWIDRNGHMSAVHYNHAFRVPVQVLFDRFGLGLGVADPTGRGVFMLDWRVQYVREVLEGMALYFEIRLIDASDKLVHYYIEMFAGRERYLAATCESVEIQVDLETRKTMPHDVALQAYIDEMLAAHRRLPWPERASRPFGIRRS